MKKYVTSRNVLILSVLVILFTANYHLLMTADVESVLPFITLMFLALIRPVYSYMEGHKGFFSFLKGIKRIDNKFLVLWTTFSLLILFSEIYNGVTGESIFFIYIVPLLLFYGLNRIFNEKEIHLMSLVSTLPFVLIALVFVVTKHKFSTNSIALIVLFAAVSAICLEIELVKRKSFIYFVFYEVLLALLFIIMAGINSRTSLLSFAVAYVINAIFILNYVLRTKHKDRIKYTIWYSLVVILGIVALYLILGKLNAILFKWGSDFSSNRFTIWEITLEKVKVLGNGYNFYTTTPDPDPELVGISLKGPHNLIFGIMGYSGLAAFLIFILILIKLVKDITIVTIKEKKIMSYSSLIIYTATYLFTGILEGFLQFPYYRVANIVWLVLLGRLYLKDDKRNRNKEIFYSRKNEIDTTNKPYFNSKTKLNFNLNSNIEINRELLINRNSSIKIQIFWFIIICAIALVSVSAVDGDGNIFGLLKVLNRYIK